jgi:phosphoribosylformylglycinamidine cyclo-ligase
VPELHGKLGDVLLAEHRSYLHTVWPLIENRLVKGMAHITGGGITENLPRILPEGCAAAIDPHSWTPLPVFGALQERGGIATDEMFRAFNMGIGLILVCAPEHVERTLGATAAAGESAATIIGHVIRGDRTVHYTR